MRLVFLLCVVTTLLSAQKKALIFGVTGQDGSYLAEFLLEKGYEVHGVKRRSSLHNTGRIDAIYTEPWELDRHFVLHYGDLADSCSVIRLIQMIQPDEIYNLAAQSHVRVSFDKPEYTSDITGNGTVRILEAIRLLGIVDKVRFYQASSSEMFGLVQEIPQSEKTPFYPRSPYAVAKVAAFWSTVNYREAYGHFACNGILFNHESPRRGETFVTRKITRAVSRIHEGLQKALYLGNLDAKRDWGYAKDYVEVMWLMLQQETPQDYVIGTGVQHSVREFVEEAFRHIGIEVSWRGQGVDEVGVNSDGSVLVRIDPRYYRPSEVDSLLADSTKAIRELNWKPKTSFRELVKVMMDADLAIARDEAYLLVAKKEGYR